MTWRVTGVGSFENKLWAARVEPVPRDAKYWSEMSTPAVVLAVRKGAYGGQPTNVARIVNWHPVPERQAYQFETVVGQKALLRVEEELQPDPTSDGRTNGNVRDAARTFGNGPQRDARRPHPLRPRDADDRRSPPGQGAWRGSSVQQRRRGWRGAHSQAYSGRSRGGGGYRGGRGRGRPPAYRSLDEMGDRGYGSSGYEDANSYY